MIFLDSRALRAHLVRLFTVLALLGSMAAAPAHGQGLPVISAAHAELGAGELRLWGQNFIESPLPKVFIGTEGLGYVEVPVVSATSELIIASVDPLTPPATYGVTVLFGRRGVPFALFSLTVGSTGPQGVPGAPGLQGPQGPTGPAGPAGPAATTIASLGALNGAACTIGAQAGQVSVAVAANGTVSFQCVALPAPPQAGDPCQLGGQTGVLTPVALPDGTTSLQCVVAPPDVVELTPDAATAGAALQFLFARSVPMHRVCTGSFGTFGSGACADPIGPRTITVAPVSSSIDGAASPFTFVATLSTATPLRLTGQVVGISMGTCNVTLSGPVQIGGQVEFVSSTPGGPLNQVVISSIPSFSAALSPAGCSLFGDINGFFQDVTDAILGTIIINTRGIPVCRNSSGVFGACAP